jgi:SAM-dependent methyltransferase
MASITEFETPATVEQAYLEYRRAGYETLRRHAQARGVFAALSSLRDIDEVARELRVAPERREILELFLLALERYGALRNEDGRYVASEGAQQGPDDFDATLISRATGAENLAALLHGDSYAGIADMLYSETNTIGSAFVGSNQALWDEFLQTPFYSYFRMRAVAAISEPGGAMLDLAAGPGFGLRELVDTTGPDGTLVGVEISADFVAEALRRLADQPAVRMVCANLDHGLPFLRDDYFDGAMLIGAYHFLRQRDTFVEHVARVLKPGGTACFGYVYLKRGSFDQELMDLRLALREPRAYPTTERELIALCGTHGLALTTSFAVGCFGWYTFTKES